MLPDRPHITFGCRPPRILFSFSRRISWNIIFPQCTSIIQYFVKGQQYNICGEESWKGIARRCMRVKWRASVGCDGTPYFRKVCNKRCTIAIGVRCDCALPVRLRNGRKILLLLIFCGLCCCFAADETRHRLKRRRRRRRRVEMKGSGWS